MFCSLSHTYKVYILAFYLPSKHIFKTVYGKSLLCQQQEKDWTLIHSVDVYAIQTPYTWLSARTAGGCLGSVSRQTADSMVVDHWKVVTTAWNSHEIRLHCQRLTKKAWRKEMQSIGTFHHFKKINEFWVSWFHLCSEASGLHHWTSAPVTSLRHNKIHLELFYHARQLCAARLRCNPKGGVLIPMSRLIH